MPEKQETIVRKMIEEVWNKGKLDALETFVEKDIVSHDPFSPAVGINKYREGVKKYRTAFPDLHMQIDELFSTADKVVARWHCTGTHTGPLEALAPTGRIGVVSGISINRMSSDRIAETFVSWDVMGLFQQLGVVTLPGKAAGASV